ncbi:MAG: hypothetical protein A3C08_03585 [Candidatus Taylorbacteria bacterium RIFCSPHIGHO2_02_FULL_47_18]|uniref:Peptidoglycan binding-like domain-containing protein n=1 Tax=Candidatus Taylorbacteria bacterium RIFCSPLOWO2_01_FULL_48_100 TaxID=1802322 RepID=A0A1G2NEL3_9BACT|nr:MAG: hypothetical protein A2670_00855 [Candidatus Taylorbacteria bacterium RIFCSPHIGHO2_01_FULL_48_38]OHA28214.1 MAG: hypothetical protein A3C08_03585 [Candidatus Taylorbacteria bacterium RIFCSPHIGHO2_02_FULL_47_18]OHA33899.1 MAG: hypothetical protein A2938_02645 [Candidatus Taylorbacteria bacterium RIFCSPLOWO2_01_FULL_48_100]OHA40874.1 MAG: hypothetical protein A3J31_03655 [Candidatus Taylorbacteria bacterium RIFCSPLOWO2_02_FULL_48_16]OHA45114.1 MAG: hypothetical protein A3H13_02930 [Candid
MKRVFSFYFFTILGLFFVFSAIHAEGWKFPREMRLGARGPDVFALQRTLNENMQTRVSERDAGSPGNETNYFGPATARAIVVFQRQNAITGETGRVGPATLVMLNKKLAQNINPVRSKEPVVPADLPTANRTSNGTHPNSRNLDQFLDIVEQVGVTQGRSAGDLQKLSEEMRSFALSTTTDFFTEFAQKARGNSISISLESPFKSRIGSLLEKFAGVFALRADAQAPSFGGMVVYVFPCTCSGNWLVGMVPLSIPTISLITHYQGTQAFAWFNAPFTLFMKGNYIPQGAPCLFTVPFACIPLPSQAQTTPILGSS